jgi:hypothetical protein
MIEKAIKFVRETMIDLTSADETDDAENKDAPQYEDGEIEEKKDKNNQQEVKNLEEIS